MTRKTRNVLIGFGLTILFLAAFISLFTVPVIERNERDRNTYVGGEISHAGVQYIDHRPAIETPKTGSPVWWGTKDGEWRRLEMLGWNHSMYTEVVLRDTASPFAHFGISRGSAEAERLQAQYNRIMADHKMQSIFNRVWIWRVREFR